MEENEIQSIIDGNLDLLEEFISKNETVFQFSYLDENKRKQFWDTIFKFLDDSNYEKYHLKCLNAIKILSRDPTYINSVISEDKLESLLKHAKLNETADLTNPKYDIVLESTKCLSNIIYNSTLAQKLCSKNYAIDGLIKRLRVYNTDDKVPYNVRFFDIKLMFLITAVNPDTRAYLKNELHGLIYLTESLDLILKQTINSSEYTFLSNDRVLLACEILKVLFNITIKSYESIDEDEEVYFRRLTVILHDLLLTPCESQEKTTELYTHIVNLLTCIPLESIDELTPKLSTADRENVDKLYEYDGLNMEAIYKLLEFLRTKLNLNSLTSNQLENLSPILTVSTNLCRKSRQIRKYLRAIVLPPLTDVHNRPEQGTTLRNHLCKLLTTPITQVRDLVADFLFVLCKENVSRMIKHTGYGNAAGLFATRGLLDGRTVVNKDYSSDSEDSDTEIYKEYQHGINPIIGCYEKPHPNPIENMTEEQGEYEAMKLVDLMDKMIKSQGGMKPCKIGPDGRPQAIEHVLELQEMIKENIKQHSDESD